MQKYAKTLQKPDEPNKAASDEKHVSVVSFFFEIFQISIFPFCCSRVDECLKHPDFPTWHERNDEVQ